jgi:hypothetical protein
METGDLVNHLGSDTDALAESGFFLPEAFHALLTMVGAYALLSVYLGWAGLRWPRRARSRCSRREAQPARRGGRDSRARDPHPHQRGVDRRARDRDLGEQGHDDRVR